MRKVLCKVVLPTMLVVIAASCQSTSSSSDPFAKFDKWAARYAAAPDIERPTMEAEGLMLAEARQEAWCSLDAEGQKKALEQTANREFYPSLPGAILMLLDDPICDDAKGSNKLLNMSDPQKSSAATK